MNVVIEIKGKRIECESESDAKKALTKEARRVRKAEKEKSERRELARRRAHEAAFKVLERAAAVARGGAAHWTAARPDGNEYDRREYNRLLKAKASDSLFDVLVVETEDGRAEFEVINNHIEVGLVNSAGHLLAVKFNDGNESYWAAVGVNGDVAALASIPGEFKDCVDDLLASIVLKKAA